MAAPSNNSTGKNSENSSSRTGEGVVMDIGTGDGRFVCRAARSNPNKFFIGIDANAKALEKISMKAMRKPSKGGLANLLFVRAAVEELPEEFGGAADEIHIHFPWGSLLRSVAAGDEEILKSLRRISAPECILEIVFGIDETRDKSEIERLGLPQITAEYLAKSLIPKYETAGFTLLQSGTLASSEWTKIETSWAHKLHGATTRQVTYLILQAT